MNNNEPIVLGNVKKGKTGKFLNMWNSNNTLLNNQWVKDEVKKEIKKQVSKKTDQMIDELDIHVE